MKFGTWLGLAAIVCAAGCSSSGKKTANQGDSKAVSEALSTGIMVEHGMKLAGVIPKPTATKVDVTQQDDAPLMLAPAGNGDSIMSLDADNPDEDTDPVTAMLMQFGDSNDHIEADVEASESDGGTADAGTTTKHYEVKFTVDDSICKNFCKGEFEGVMVQALKLKKGGITKHVNRNFKLDCRDKGAETCEADKDKGGGKKDAGEDKGGGGTDAGGGGSGGSEQPIGAVSTYSSLLRSFSTQACMCVMSKAKPPFCEDDHAGLSQHAVDCVVGKLTDNQDDAAVKSWAACAGAWLKQTATPGCKASCSEEDCGAAKAAAAADSCALLPDAVKTAIDGCKLGEAP